MKGPALWLKHYLRCREIMSHGEWVILLAVAAQHGAWVRRAVLMRMPIRARAATSTTVKIELDRLQSADLVEVREVPAPRGGQMTCEARITSKGLHFLGWPELTVVHSPEAV